MVSREEEICSIDAGNLFHSVNKMSQKQFSTQETAPDEHHYYNSLISKPGRGFHQAVNREIQILGNSLADGIVVKAVEDRMDIYSAMIQGPKDTPYEGGVFLFDIKLPENYPRAPPKVFYHAYLKNDIGRRINPNLYTDGTVCMSLLGTWIGPGWDPKNSTLLQVLVSIQGLILVEEPYFNEPGHMRPSGNDTSKAYNRQLLILLFKSLNNIATNPPSVFKNEIKQYIDFYISYDIIFK